jgi:hypothetical protein
MEFPTLHCICPNNHKWATLVPNEWFLVENLQCPHCYEQVKQIKAGDWRILEQIKQAQRGQDRSCTNPITEEPQISDITPER